MQEIDLTQANMKGARFDGAEIEAINVHASRSVPAVLKGEK